MNNRDDIEDYLCLLTDRIKEERKKRNISQLQLANILGHTSPNYISKIENRARGSNYNLKHLYAISKAFNITIQNLLPPYHNMNEDNGDN